MAGMVTLPGIEIAPEEPRETFVPVDAALLKKTVQVELALLPRDDGVQLKLLSCGVAATVALSVNDCDPPFRVAVICVV